MNSDLVLIACLAGAANWAFRALPILLLRGELKAGGAMGRFLASTGPAAIATLFIASVLPQLWPQPQNLIALACGIGATFAGFLPKKSVVTATMCGAFGYGLGFWVIMG